MSRDQLHAAFLGLAVGDALGVPVEFSTRSVRKADPVTDMRGYGTWNQPPGTWSDDSSLTFILAEVLISGYSPAKLAQGFLRWRDEGYRTAHGEAFDIGRTTSTALARFASGIPATQAGPADELSNGNGALMRILPLAFVLQKYSWDDRFATIREVASVTHGHIRSTIACFLYLELAIAILRVPDITVAYHHLSAEPAEFLRTLDIPGELQHFKRVLSGELTSVPESAIRSSGYVIDTLEAAIWCLLQTHGFSSAITTAVNLGDDTDTTAAVTGGLAGILYGTDSIPESWTRSLARANDIRDLADRFAECYSVGSGGLDS